ncbi:hypothetical protein [Metabacillus iocasae]|uniref:Uncharacterized protein n=1 Tax=Priestia iocasae TaxID=2291674 RepID=A0ABS2QWM5_9BACI|nr:hypothetical protein [Metabacillus iocasae]MBM7703873.1 hypothetical protein [Metabacillus iocasae]
MGNSSVVLEYRLLKGKDEYVPLYHYEHIELEQILARRECEFYVKEGVTYKQRSSAVEDDLHIIYVDEYEHHPKEKEDPESRHSIKVEVRAFNARQNHPVITTKYMRTHLEVLSFIGAVYTYVNRKEWERDSAEMDEDRMVYVLYVTETGFKFE